MKKVAFITYASEAKLTEDDQLALPALKKAGIEVTPILWNKPHDLYAFDAVVFRSCWDYHLHWREFADYIEKLKKRTHVFNSPDTMLWNLNKKHLLDLAPKGVCLPKTKWFAQGQKVEASEFEFFKNSPRVVVKPSISLNGYDTYLLPSQDANKIAQITNDLLSGRDVLVQDFIPEVQTAGETSLVFFNGKFSHALCKIPKGGEFRVQVDYGGTRKMISPPAAIVSDAENILKIAGKDYLYARVDGVIRDKEFVLMELEMIDPSLFFILDAHSCDRFAHALRERLD